MTPDEIEVGGIYQGPRTEMSDGAIREVTWISGNECAIRIPHSYGVIPWDIPLSKFAAWAQRKVTDQ